MHFAAEMVSHQISMAPNNEFMKHKYRSPVATSGDTGGAVASAFDQCPEFKVVVLFPEG
ncbi:MAG: threonine synthase, partial [Idiomarinaceae bacterium]|nr:threonine synthase [Idiomarinaceae bacterium]